MKTRILPRLLALVISVLMLAGMSSCNKELKKGSAERPLNFNVVDVVPNYSADEVQYDVTVFFTKPIEDEEAIKIFKPYQINDELVAIANPNCIVMHCLPAHRGQEITNEVMEGPHSVVFDQAENRLHAQKAVLYTLMKDQ